MSDFPIEMSPFPPEAIVLNEDTRTVEGEFDSYGAASAWIAESNDLEENRGLPLSSYSIVPVRATPGGKDLR